MTLRKPTDATISIPNEAIDQGRGRRLRLRRVTHGNLGGFWLLYRPGIWNGTERYGGRPLFAFKIFWGRRQKRREGKRDAV